MQDVPNQPDGPKITLDDLDKSAATVAPTSTDVPVRFAEVNAAFIRVSEENSALKEENEKLKSTAKTVEILNDLMKPSANKAFYYMFAYSGTVGLMLIMNAFGCFSIPLTPFRITRARVKRKPQGVPAPCGLSKPAVDWRLL